ncbi:putative phosphatidylinositol-4-phosphate 5-kinase-like protein, partial [Trypanosoma theileri]
MLETDESVTQTNDGVVNETPSLVRQEKKLVNSDNTEVQFPSGSKYVGSIRNGQLNGYGKYYYFPSGDIYEGEWESDMKHGKGTYTYASGDRYEGEWYRGKKHNRGTYLFANGDKYVGFWKDDKIHGYGVFTIKNSGNRYEGFWEEAYRHGHGVLYNSNGDIYDGEWVRGKEGGFGIFIQSSGNIYCGDWKNGEMDGKGVLKEHRILFAVDFIQGYAVTRVPIPEGTKPPPEWLKAYDFYMTYTGNHFKYGDRSAEDMDELRHALEKMKLESALWKKRYDNLLSKSLETRKDVQVSFPSVENHNSVSEALKETNHVTEVEESNTAKMVSQIDHMETPHANAHSVVEDGQNVECETENKPLKESKDPNLGTVMNGKDGKKELRWDSLSLEPLRSEIVKLRQHNIELMRNNEELEKDKVHITAEKDDLVRELTSYTDRVEDLERRFNEAVSMELAASREVMELRARIQEVEGALAEKSNPISVNTDTQDQHQRVEDMERKLEEVNRANAELQLYSDALKKEANRYRDQYRALVNQRSSGNDTDALTQLQMDLERVEGQLRTAEENARTQQIELDSCKSHCMDLESSLLVMTRQKISDPKLLLALDRKIDLLRGLQEKNAELSRILEETKVELEISKKQAMVNQNTKHMVESSEAKIQDELKQVVKELKKEQKKYKRAQTDREALAVDLYEEQVKHARAERVLQSLQGCFTVMARIQNCKEGTANPCVHVNEMDYSQVLLNSSGESQSFQFDVCFDDKTSWDAIFSEIRRPITIVKMGFHVSYVTL